MQHWDKGYAPPPQGSLEVVLTYAMSQGAGRAMELSGWSERDGEPAECVVILDGNRMVIGAGASIVRRTDLERATGHSLGLVGWKAVADPPTQHACLRLGPVPRRDRIGRALQL